MAAQEQAGDGGLWTSTLVPGGGQPTLLAHVLPKVLPILKYSPTLTPGEPPGVLDAGLLAVNTSGRTVTAQVGGSRVTLMPAQVYFVKRNSPI